MNLDLSGKRALVGGSSKGIGRACAEALAGQGASVVLTARDGAALEATCAALPRRDGQEHGFFAADFDRPDALESLVRARIDAGERFDILVHNSGGPPGGPAASARAEEFRTAFERHLICGQVLAQALLPGMREAGYGRIVNIISTSVYEPIPGLGVSNTVRGAVASWAKTLSRELASDGITVNNVLPGATQTERLENILKTRAEKQGRSVADVERDALAEVPAGRFAEAAEIAAAVAFFASPAASYVTGVSMPVDGGRSVSI